MIWEYLVGDVREVLAGLPDGSVQTIVTSPPYWGLRDYGIPPSIWGGDPECEHEWVAEEITLRWGAKNPNSPMMQGSKKYFTEEATRTENTCHKCGAWSGCLGLEPTPEMFIEHMVEVCRGLWRVLRDDGVFWLNLGDSYTTGGGGAKVPGGGKRGFEWRSPAQQPNRMKLEGLKPKDLVMMPARVALALQEDGWWVRSKVIWFKPNPMPESCTDRPTSSYEEIFELTKSGKPTYWVNAYRGTGARKQPEPDYLYFDLKRNITYEEEPEGYDPKAKDKDGNNLWKRENQWIGHDYFYDNDAVREPVLQSSIERINQPNFNEQTGGPKDYGTTGINRNRSARKILEGFANNPTGRNLRNVWQIATQPYPEAHFATFPEKIPETCIKAGTSEWGCCPQCGAPWERVVEKEEGYGKRRCTLGEAGQSVHPSGVTHDLDGPPRTTKGFQPTCECVEKWKKACGADSKGEYHGKAIKDYSGTGAENPSEVKARILHGMVPKVTTGFQQTCDCPLELEPVPCTVLDPFAGSGTTLKVARDLGRSAIGIDISSDYKKLAVTRARLDTKDILSYGGETA